MALVAVEDQGIRVKGFVAYLDVRLSPSAARMEFIDTDFHHGSRGGDSEGTYNVRHPGLGYRSKAGESDPLGPAHPEIRHGALKAFQVSKGPAALFRQMERSRGGLDTAATLLEQNQSGLPSQDPQVLADRRGSQMQPGGGAMNRTRGDHCAQDDEPMWIQHSLIVWRRLSIVRKYLLVPYKRSMTF